MAPRPSLAESARYHRARNRAFAAWANSQPQYVIPGVLEQTDDPVGLFEPAAAAIPPGGLDSCGTEPRHTPRTDGIQSAVSEHPNLLGGVVVGAAHQTATGADANTCLGTRVRSQKGA